MTGLEEAKIEMMADAIDDILAERGRLPASTGRPAVLDLFDQIVMTSVLARRNATKELAGGWFGLSQPRVSQIKSFIGPLLDEPLDGIELTLEEAAEGRTLVVDGTHVPTGNGNPQGGRTIPGSATASACPSRSPATPTEGCWPSPNRWPAPATTQPRSNCAAGQARWLTRTGSRTQPT